jgi:6-phosphofructokinase
LHRHVLFPFVSILTFHRVLLSSITLIELRKELDLRFAERGVKCTLRHKTINEELRCADPLPADIVRSRDIGYAAASVMLTGEHSLVACVANGAVKSVHLRAYQVSNASSFLRVHFRSCSLIC